MKNSFLIACLLPVGIGCAGGLPGSPDASANARILRMSVRPRDSFPDPKPPERPLYRNWVDATAVGPGYLIAPARPFGYLLAEDGSGIGLDPAVTLRDGNRTLPGRIVGFDRRMDSVLIRAETPAPPEFTDDPALREFLRRYFSSWGRHVKNKPRL